MITLPRPLRLVVLVLFAAAGVFGLARPASADTLLTGQAALDWASAHRCHFEGGGGWWCTMNDNGLTVTSYTATNLARPASFPTTMTGTGSGGTYRWELDPYNNTTTSDSWFMQCWVSGNGQAAPAATGPFQTSCGTLPAGTVLDVYGVLSPAYTNDGSNELTYGNAGGTFSGDSAFAPFSLSAPPPPSAGPAPAPDAVGNAFDLSRAQLVGYVQSGVGVLAVLLLLGLGVIVLLRYVNRAALASYDAVPISAPADDSGFSDGTTTF